MKTLFLLFVLTATSYTNAQITGPNAPDVSISYVSSFIPGFSFQITNPTSSNNYMDSYLEFDTNINAPDTNQLWKFQGYLIFQLQNDTINFSETFNPIYSKLAAIVDISDTNSTINLRLDSCVSTSLALENTGNLNNYILPYNAFTSLPFTENETYCFRVVAFAKNSFSFDPNCGISDYALIGQTNGYGFSVPSICATATESLGLSAHSFETVNIGPNPSNGAFSIEQKSITESSLHVSIFNELGQVVLEKTLSEKATEFEVPNPGVYMLQITSDGKYSRRKIIRL